MPLMPFTASTEEVNQGAAWYTLYTRHQHEKTVASLLLGKGLLMKSVAVEIDASMVERTGGGSLEPDQPRV